MPLSIGTPLTTWEIILYEGSNEIQVQYLSAGSDGRTASAVFASPGRTSLGRMDRPGALP